MKSARRKCHLKHAGYSLIEMMVTLAIGLILVSVALPTMVSAIQSYRLNSTAQQVANLIELTRYSAIRRNSLVNLRMQVIKGNTVFFVDLDNNNQLDTNEPMVMLPNDMQLANKQPLTPDGSSTGLPSTKDFTNQITFDYRGTVILQPGDPLAAYFLALGYVSQAQYGCRAITLTPMGQAKLWKAPASGTWTGM